MVLCSLVYGSDRNSGGIENMKINNSQKFWSLMTARIFLLWLVHLRMHTSRTSVMHIG